MPLTGAASRRVRGHLHNVAPSAFVQLIAVERETCSLVVSHEGAGGVLSFVNGVLWDAAVGERRGEAAAIEILGWEVADIEMHAGDEPVRRAISAPLTFLLLEAMRQKDETAASEAPGSHPETPIGSLVREHDGMIGGCLIDIPTGTFLEEHFAPRGGALPWSRSCCELARLALALTANLGLRSVLEDFVLFSSRRLLVLRFLPAGLLVALIVDPARMGLPAIYTLLRRLDVEELSPWQE